MTAAPDDTSDGASAQRSDAVRNRVRLLEAAARLVAERGVEHVTMHEVAEAAGVGKGTLFRRFGDRDGLLLALLGEAEAEFQEAYTSGPPPLGPGAPAKDRLTAFGRALIERIAADADLGAALGRQVLHERRHASDTGRAFHRHVSTLLRKAGVDGDHDMLAHALLAFANFETADYLRKECEVPVARLQATWADLVRRLTRSDGKRPPD
ncbi:TetR/AcrR family transcriptional regulator [Streptomyces lutosisoli]|uniref:TetR/AcrR family transcriptional regulator n=1 Tax=Streptomyces lutosisoli TaxID=2665721 RepID=A0ABW2VHI8_9ACTN